MQGRHPGAGGAEGEQGEGGEGEQGGDPRDEQGAHSGRLEEVVVFPILGDGRCFWRSAVDDPTRAESYAENGEPQACEKGAQKL